MTRHRTCVPCNCNASLGYAGNVGKNSYRVICKKCRHKWMVDGTPPKSWERTDTGGIRMKKSHGPCDCEPLSANVQPYTHGRFRLRCRRCNRSWVTFSIPANNAPQRRGPKPHFQVPVVVAAPVPTPPPAPPPPEPEPLPEQLPDPTPTPPPIARPFSADKPYDDRLITDVDLAAGTPLGVELEGDDYLRYCEICKAPRENAVITYSPKEAAR
jgi:hypothetical protein